jgi:hypothetical protein
MKLVRKFPILRRSVRGRGRAAVDVGRRDACPCPIRAAMLPSWDALIADVERGLEAMRQREMKRRLRGLSGLGEEGRTAADRLTRDLLRRTVLEALQNARRAGGGVSPGDVQVIREMFPAA